MEKFYRIYGKGPGMRNFGALDLNKGAVVGNLIYATFFDVKENAEKAQKGLSEQNPDWVFQVRGV